MPYENYKIDIINLSSLKMFLTYCFHESICSKLFISIIGWAMDPFSNERSGDSNESPDDDPAEDPKLSFIVVGEFNNRGDSEIYFSKFSMVTSFLPG